MHVKVNLSLYIWFIIFKSIRFQCVRKLTICLWPGMPKKSISFSVDYSPNVHCMTTSPVQAMLISPECLMPCPCHTTIYVQYHEVQSHMHQLVHEHVLSHAFPPSQAPHRKLADARSASFQPGQGVQQNRLNRWYGKTCHKSCVMPPPKKKTKTHNVTWSHNSYVMLTSNHCNI